MELEKLQFKPETLSTTPKLPEASEQFNRFLHLLGEKQIPEALISKINAQTSQINQSILVGKPLLNSIKKIQSQIVTLVEKEVKLVPVGHYRNIWLALGMAAFGIPLGLAFGLSLDNIGLMAVGIPIGLGIGVAVGSAFDNKAKKEGRQLDIELK